MTTLVEVGIKALLDASTALSAIVGTRKYMGWLPQNSTYPALCWFEVSGNEIAEGKVARSRYQFSAYAEDEITAKNISNVVIDALKNYSGVPGGVTVPKTIYLGRNRFREDDSGLYHYAADIEIIFTGE